MAKTVTLSVLILFFIFLISSCEGKDYPNRWVFVDKWLRSDSEMKDVENIVKTASEHGLNGIVLLAGLDRLRFQSPGYFRRLNDVKRVCEQHNIEIIPMVFSVGMGGSVLGYDKNLAAGMLVADALFVVEKGKARLIPEPPVKIVNGEFEQFNGSRLQEFHLQDKPGNISYEDREVFKSGKASLKFEGFGRYRHGHARVMQEVEVQPHRCYKLSCWVKAEELKPSSSFRMEIYSLDGRNIGKFNPEIPSTTEWQKIVGGFNSLKYSKVRVYIGAWGGKSGKFWVDDLQIEEVGLLNVLRRPGTPVTVKGEQTKIVYEEGRDFAPIKDPKLNFKFDHEAPVIKILPGSRIKNGERLRVSYYHGLTTFKKYQVGVCMSEPKLYEILREQTKLIHKHLAPNKYFLNIDEIRMGGACQACKKRNMTMGQILGDCITKQVRIIHEVNPQAEVFIWSDMLDPHHNAHDDYYLIDGDFSGSWKYIPKDLVIVCWYYDKRIESLRFFSSLGFSTMASACCDSGNIDILKQWLKALQRTDKACGIMYTTWGYNYKLLAPFGDIVTAAGKLN